ncbi:sensor histidine kinase [Jannaschia pohangensis]|uniref:histidine kinase n=1 Tax=Jannaschia pohangensis TaxID=390807 RepID=A0A1I3UKX0_9RHOB|nr:HAMP domain-containing sensor histidine kinase [Jannaschia pohangensis]SFJ82397.1 two-component system, OmpR family, sensor kinase [Jannaschia pohangensis]
MSARRSLRRRLAVLISLGLGAVWLVATGLMAFILHTEQDEFSDLALRETAILFQPILLSEWQDGTSAGLPAVPEPADAGEALVYLLQDRDGTVFLQSGTAALAELPDGAPREGYRRTRTHAFYTTAPDADGRFVTFGDPLAERDEAFRESLLAFVVPMLAMLPLAYLLVSWIVQTGLRPLGDLRAEIANRGEGRLDPVVVEGLPDELQEITSSLNGLMKRLGTALDGERAFATNAAHELRTPVAIALAQVQRLRTETADPGALTRIQSVEATLNRMSDLVARLLQLARADAGIGAGRTDDLVALLGHVLDDVLRDPGQAGRIVTTLPQGPVAAMIDPDAWAIVAGNLIENGLRHAPGDAQVTVTLAGDGTLRVANPAPGLTEADPATLTRRFQRGNRAGAGFGLGLHIADTIARQAGGRLDVSLQGDTPMFEAAFTVARPG